MKRLWLLGLLSGGLLLMGQEQGCEASDHDGDGWTTEDGDCDDMNPDVHPGADETCNGVDDDCDGSVDQGVETTFYADVDADGYGDASDSVSGCTAPTGYVAVSGDCDDADSSIYPGAPESCNGIDDDCDGTADAEVLGDDESCAGSSCLEILESRSDAEDGVYWLDWDGTGDTFQTYCDMTTDGGGWTLAFATYEFMAIIDSDPGVSWQNFENRSITDFENPPSIMEGHAVPDQSTEVLWMCATGTSSDSFKWWSGERPPELIDNAHTSGGHETTFYAQSSNANYTPTHYVEGSTNYPTYRYFFIANGTASCDAGNYAMWGGSCFWYECGSSSGYCAAYRMCDGVNSDGSTRFWIFWR